MLWVSRLSRLSILFATCLVSSQLALAANIDTDAAENKIISCFNPETGNHYLTNIKSSVPENCQNIKIMAIPEYKQSTQDAGSGLRPAEKTQLEQLNQQEEILNQALLNRTQHVDERVGMGVYGSWQDYRQAQCFAYQARIEEARADRKDDVKLNRQIQRDLTQVKYYCR